MSAAIRGGRPCKIMTPYQAALETVALFDLGPRAKLEVSGPDARSLLHNVSTNDINKLAVGDTREAFVTTSKARVIAHVWITCRKSDDFLVDAAPGQADKLLQHCNRHIISEQVDLADRTSELALLRLVGPKSAELLERAGVAPTRRHRLLALDGCDAIVPVADAETLKQKLLDSGAILGDADAYNLLRVEAGLPEYGIDIDEDRLAMEVNRPDAISYTKGCYLGQETIVMARDRGQANRKMMGLKVRGDSPLPVASGAKVLRGKDEVGQVTSSVHSARLGGVVALAYMRRGSWDAGVEVILADARAAVVSVLPFVA